VLQVGGFLGLGGHLVGRPYTLVIDDVPARKSPCPARHGRTEEAVGIQLSCFLISRWLGTAMRASPDDIRDRISPARAGSSTHGKALVDAAEELLMQDSIARNIDSAAPPMRCSGASPNASIPPADLAESRSRRGATFQSFQTRLRRRRNPCVVRQALPGAPGGGNGVLPRCEYASAAFVIGEFLSILCGLVVAGIVRARGTLRFRPGAQAGLA